MAACGLHLKQRWLLTKLSGLKVNILIVGIFHTGLKKFTQYPDLKNADKATIETVLVDWGKRIIEHASKKVNTYNTDRFGADYGRDNFTRSLINHHLNPLATMEDFVRKLKEYNFKMQQNNQPSQDQIDSLKKKHPVDDGKTQDI